MQVNLLGPRIRQGMSAAKARGVPLGNPRLSEAQAQGRLTMKHNALLFARTVAPVLMSLRESGVTSLRGIARALNTIGVQTARGNKWTSVQVKAVLNRTDLPACSEFHCSG